MSKARNLTGLRFGRLTAVRVTDERVTRSVVWECVCDCGKGVFVRSSNLISGATQSCGCLMSERAGESKQIDLSGRRFGRLTAVKPTKMRQGKSVVWECHCDCGNTTFASAGKLVSNRKCSCGCKRLDSAKNKAKDLTGQRFGKLTAIRPTDKRCGKSVVWECKCDCGNTAFYSTIFLHSKAQSCGCIRKTNYVLGTSLNIIGESEEKVRKDNLLGTKGVYYNSKRNVYVAGITFKGVTFRKGYRDFDDAREARMKMKQIHEEFLEWWDALSEEEKAEACAEYELEKNKQGELLKRKIKEVL